ncbi:hypothetical protein CRUP_002325 [Coryphaenoides rupestris]|nr:hypothetical protein CRUP_002325 [Coryphaenoides rupestris]
MSQLRSDQVTSTPWRSGTLPMFWGVSLQESFLLHALTAKLERSAGEFITARKRLEEIVAAEGNAELNDFLAKGSADLNTELARNRELSCACVDVVDVLEEVRRHVVSMSSRGRRVRLKGLNQLDGAEVGSSYDFLKSIMG